MPWRAKVEPLITQRLVICGAAGSGKTTLRLRAAFLRDSEDPGDWASRPDIQTSGVEKPVFSTRVVNDYNYQLWDVTWFRSGEWLLTTADIITFVCDASELGSFEATKSMFDGIVWDTLPELIVLLVNKMEVAVEGVYEAAVALEKHMRETINTIIRPYELPEVIRTEVSMMDPPTAVMWKLGGGEGVLKHLVWVSKSPGSVRIPAVGQVENIRRVSSEHRKGVRGFDNT